jgi:PTS system fructose-specific IIA component/PTS system nitrogen regulatory IIA component
VADALLAGVAALQSQTVPLIILETSEKQEALRQLVTAAVQHAGMGVEQQPMIYHAIMEREALGPTGIGRGFAFPHARSEQIEAIALAIGLSSQGIDFESLDGQPVHTIGLLISPTSDPGVHLRTLEGISRNLRRLV